MPPIIYSVDIEATGVDYRNDRMIQLAVLKVEGENVEAWDDLCYTDIEIPPIVAEMTGITNAKLEEAYWPDETDAFMALQEGNRPENIFLSHGNRLDLAMLANEGLEIVMKKVDTDKCARALLLDAPSYKLGDLIARYGLKERAEAVAKTLGKGDIEAHDALSDAIWHYALYTLLLEKANGDAKELVRLTAEPMMLEKITFGKFKGKRFEEVFEKEPGALVWMYANMTEDWDDLEYTLRHWLQKKPFFWKQAQEEKKKLTIF
ncbi:exonuclease domain-containing protein [Hydrogenimonas sp. SS33]|uniref:exonuclease domain-containing protein n=1 Tax=Hydrogenimonas leucolamina TaxID=2954236 RepID=UPI00336C252F